MGEPKTPVKPKAHLGLGGFRSSKPMEASETCEPETSQATRSLEATAAISKRQVCGCLKKLSLTVGELSFAAVGFQAR